jgi:hypothetical protein
VDQISPPFRIAIVAMLAMCAIWFTVLRPKDPAAAPVTPTAPGTTGLANDVSAAKGAAAASDAANARTQAATGGTAPTSAATPKAAGVARGAHDAVAGKTVTPAAKAQPKAEAAGRVATSDRSAPLLRALDRNRTVVLLFWNKRASDDRSVRSAVARVARHDGHVVVKAVPVSEVGRYMAITRGAEVLQSPTVLVIGPDRKARPIVGFTTTGELDQAVGDTLAGAAKRHK